MTTYKTVDGKTSTVSKYDITGKYDMMLGTYKMGLFVIEKGRTGREIHLELDLKYRDYYGAPDELYRYADKNGYVAEKYVWEYIEDRVAPRTQAGIDELLESVGIYDYDPLYMYICGNGASPQDPVWVQFDRKSQFKDVNPIYENFYIAPKPTK